MTTIKLHNTRTRRKEEFTPLDPANVRMYVCGPTVYDRAHLGNARPVVVFDVLYRLLRHVYGEGHVTYVRNFTDVDDKINDAALARKQAGDPRSLEALIRERTDETIAWYHADMDALGALRPDHEPRATEWIAPMIAMTADLIAKGHAYVAAGHVLFRVRSYKDYGKLSGRSVDDMIAGARVEVSPFKEDPMDFVLWKPSSDDLPGWDSPWGRGRPGWHIECSAMARELLGETFDIHAGGIDLQFPHHENEIAQSACALATPDDPEGRGKFARYWLHNEMLQVEGKKMSKSLGNFFTVRDLLDKGVPGEVIRFVMLSTHYSKPMDWTEERARQAEATLREWRKLTAEAALAGPVPTSVLSALSDDLNSSLAIAQLHQIARRGDSEGLVAGANLLGLLTPELSGWERPRYVQSGDIKIGTSEITAKRIDGLIAERANAKAARDFARADRIRDALSGAGVILKDGKEKTEWEFGPNIDLSVLESLK
jgi:cysteinyl-tRNA synthetase